MSRRCAVVIGEALVDLLESDCCGEPVYRPAVGGAPLNVAVGVARLGGSVEFIGSVSDDILGGRIRSYLAATGVGIRGCVATSVPTTLAVTSFAGAEPDFHFYGEPPSYGQLRPDQVDLDLVAGASLLHCGSIALLCPSVLAAARRAWGAETPLRTFDPNVRPRMVQDRVRLRALVEEFASTADVVKLSAQDGEALYGVGPERAARRLRAAGAATVVVTLGARGTLVVHQEGTVRAAAAPARVVDTTGAGDAVMAALIHRLLATGLPGDVSGWRDLVGFAAVVAALACEAPGGASAMPTRERVNHRLGLAGG